MVSGSSAVRVLGIGQGHRGITSVVREGRGPGPTRGRADPESVGNRPRGPEESRPNSARVSGRRRVDRADAEPDVVDRRAGDASRRNAARRSGLRNDFNSDRRTGWATVTLRMPLRTAPSLVWRQSGSPTAAFQAVSSSPTPSRRPYPRDANRWPRISERALGSLRFGLDDMTTPILPAGNMNVFP